MSEMNVRWQWLRPLVEYTRTNAALISKIADFVFSFAVYLAMAIFGALWALMSYAGVDAETAMGVVNGDIYHLALFTAVFLMIAYAFGAFVEYIGKL